MRDISRPPGADGVAPTLPELVGAHADTSPTRTAVVDERGRLTYAELHRSALGLAAVLSGHGVAHGDRIGLWLPNSAFWLQAHLAAAHLGAIAVGINARYPVREAARIARTAGVSVLVIDPDSIGVADAAAVAELCAVEGLDIGLVVSRECPVATPEGVTCLVLSHEPGVVDDFCTRAEPKAPSSVFASSGSTGVPKLILHDQAGISAHSLAVADAFGYTADDAVVLGQLPLCGVWGFNTTYGALAGGATVVLMARFDAEAAVDLIERHAVTTANGPDAFLRQLFVAARRDPGRIAALREIGFSTFSNDALELVTEAEQLGITLFQVYGSSEQQALMVRRPSVAPPRLRADAGGEPSNAATRTRIRDVDTGALVGSGTSGLLESCGPNVMLGYLTPDGIDTSAFTEDGWVRTGDLAELTDGGLRYLSRAKDALRLSGFLVDPQEIERRIETFEEVVEAKVVGIDIDRGPRCIAFIRPRSAVAFDEAALLERCRAELASFKVPHRIFPIEAFPAVDGANGPRIQRLALRDMATERVQT